MPIAILIGLSAGLVSAMLFYSAARGEPLLGTVLLLLTPLPSLLAGLGWGWLAAAAGGVAGFIAMGLVASWRFGTGYFLALGLPAALAAYVAYLSRPRPDDDAVREWYPVGRLVAGAALYAGALPVLVLPLIGGDYGVLRPAMAEFLRRILTNRGEELGSLGQLSDQQIEGLAELFIAALPGVFAAYWLLIFAVNVYLAGRIAKASGRLARDWPDLPAMEYPRGFPLLVAIALVASFVPGTAGIAGTSFSGALLTAYLIAGLALMHFIARARAPWLLWLVYGSLLLLGPYAALVITLGGLLEPVLNLKQKFGAPPQST